MSELLNWVVFKHGPAHDFKHLMWDHDRGPIVYVAPSPNGCGYAVVDRPDYPGALRYRDSNLGPAKSGEGASHIVYVPDFRHRKVRTGGLLHAIRDRIATFRERDNAPLGCDGLCMACTYDDYEDAIR